MLLVWGDERKVSKSFRLCLYGMNWIFRDVCLVDYVVVFFDS